MFKDNKISVLSMMSNYYPVRDRLDFSLQFKYLRMSAESNRAEQILARRNIRRT